MIVGLGVDIFPIGWRTWCKGSTAVYCLEVVKYCHRIFFNISCASTPVWMLQGLVGSQESAALASRQPAKLIVFAAF
jgi:hypothetical protein